MRIHNDPTVSNAAEISSELRTVHLPKKLLNNSARTESSSDKSMGAQFLFTNSVFAMLYKAL